MAVFENVSAAPVTRLDATMKLPAAHTNRLSLEKSPYLLQHQHNPVDWMPWGQEAFFKARKENKPILLSVGYSTCHWCHVMERESFEDEVLAKFLNAHFVSIKVDREERPDVDKIYMTAAQAMGQQGGWPLNVFLTPDLKPFYAGTYFPPEPRYGRPSFLQVLQQLAQIWQHRAAEVQESANGIHQQLRDMMNSRPTNQHNLDPKLLPKAASAFKAEYDKQNGGFGVAPKFPRPSQPAFLLQYGHQQKDSEAVKMVLHTCEAMAKGGMNDQIGGGFARYSVDSKWLVPHFEKMLYDNAQLVHLYLDAGLITGGTNHFDTARAILSYVLRDMTHPSGGFFSAEDADSEGKEGKFYCWTQTELASFLNEDELKVAIKYYGITPEGNFLDHSDPNPLPHQNVLSVANSTLTDVERRLLPSIKTKVFSQRTRRIRPHLDDKILASWNGLMLGAMARASVVLGDDEYLKAAEKNVRFIKKALWDKPRHTLYHRWREGERDSVQLLDGYANYLAGVLELYQVTLDAEYLQFAIEIAEAMMTRFYDAEHGGFWQSAGGDPELILRIKEDYDGAEPSGNSVAALAILKLAAITGRADLQRAGEKSIQIFSERLERSPQAVPYLLSAMAFAVEPPKRVVIASPTKAGMKTLLQAVHRTFQPHKVVLGTVGPVEPFAKALKPREKRATAYVCTGTVCQPPTSVVAELEGLLR